MINPSNHMDGSFPCCGDLGNYLSIFHTICRAHKQYQSESSDISNSSLERPLRGSGKVIQPRQNVRILILAITLHFL